jgi:hypothetical protein
MATCQVMDAGSPPNAAPETAPATAPATVCSLCAPKACVCPGGARVDVGGAERKGMEEKHGPGACSREDEERGSGAEGGGGRARGSSEGTGKGSGGAEVRRS